MLDDYVRSKDAKTAVLLAKEYRVDSWLKVAYIRLLLEHAPLKIEELLQTPSLDWETIARLSYAKQLELCEFNSATSFCCNMSDVCYCAASTSRKKFAIERSFKMELDNMKWTPSALAAAPPLPGKYIVFVTKRYNLSVTQRQVFPEKRKWPNRKKKTWKDGLLEATRSSGHWFYFVRIFSMIYYKISCTSCNDTES